MPEVVYAGEFHALQKLVIAARLAIRVALGKGNVLACHDWEGVRGFLFFV
jgi:hypothetical protein